MMLKEIERLWQRRFGGTLPVKAPARTGVELPGNGIELGLTEAGPVCALAEVLAEQAVGVLVDAALPRAVWIGAADCDAGDF